MSHTVTDQSRCKTAIDHSIFRSYNRSNVKIIYLPSGLGDLPPGRKRFIKDRCPVDACSLTASSRHESTADIRLLQGDAFFDADVRKPPRQVWVLWLLESPQNSPHFRNAEGLINWTATYRSDSTIVTPYEKYVDFEALNLSPPDAGNRTTPRNWLRPSPSPPLPLLNDNAANGGGTRNPARRGFDRRRKMALSPMKNYAEGKTGLVAWFVSNCVASNRRYSYVQELRQYIPVDVYGDCGDLQCPRSHQIECDRLIRRRYKFYLAFENSNCEQYITEKFFRNALW
jgi:glycoprotein 3-alpha-L-fucosyltransferase